MTVALEASVERGGGGVKIRTENLKFCHVTAAQSGDNPAATLKANLIERKPTRLLEALDIFRLKKVTCATTRRQRRRGADCCAPTCLWGLTKVHGATRERARSHYSLTAALKRALVESGCRLRCGAASRAYVDGGVAPAPEVGGHFPKNRA